MDKLSFASVYRTAAILAAFSRGDGLAHGPTHREEPRVLARPPVSPVRVGGTIKRIVDRCRRTFRQIGAGPLDGRSRSSDVEAGATGWWMLQRSNAASHTEAASGPPLVSHFAFSHETDLHRSRARRR